MVLCLHDTKVECLSNYLVLPCIIYPLADLFFAIVGISWVVLWKLSARSSIHPDALSSTGKSRLPASSYLANATEEPEC